MKIKLDIPADRIAQLFSSAIEGGDPVTTASKGGWCWGIYWHSHKAQPPKGYWYGEPATFSRDFTLEVVEVCDEGAFVGQHVTEEKTIAENVKAKAFKVHKLTAGQVAAGLAVMAKEFPDQFGQIMRNQIDAPCADSFLQACIFGKEVYA